MTIPCLQPESKSSSDRIPVERRTGYAQKKPEKRPFAPILGPFASVHILFAKSEFCNAGLAIHFQKTNNCGRTRLVGMLVISLAGGKSSSDASRCGKLMPRTYAARPARRSFIRRDLVGRRRLGRNGNHPHRSTHGDHSQLSGVHSKISLLYS